DHEPVVLEHGDLVVGIERQEGGLELLAPVEPYVVDLVGDADLLQRDRGLAAVRRLGRVQADHRDLRGAPRDATTANFCFASDADLRRMGAMRPSFLAHLLAAVLAASLAAPARAGDVPDDAVVA